MVDRTKGANLSPRESGAYYQETTIQHGKMTRELQTIRSYPGHTSATTIFEQLLRGERKFVTLHSYPSLHTKRRQRSVLDNVRALGRGSGAWFFTDSHQKEIQHDGGKPGSRPTFPGVTACSALSLFVEGRWGRLASTGIFDFLTNGLRAKNLPYSSNLAKPILNPHTHNLEKRQDR